MLQENKEIAMDCIHELAALIAAMTACDGFYATTIPGLTLSRFSTTDTPRTSVCRAVWCVVAQGTKRILLNDEQYLYDPNTFFVPSLDIPLVSQIIAATPAKPCLSLAIE